jgi:hypothetical protein
MQEKVDEIIKAEVKVKAKVEAEVKRGEVFS